METFDRIVIDLVSWVIEGEIKGIPLDSIKKEINSIALSNENVYLYPSGIEPTDWFIGAGITKEIIEGKDFIVSSFDGYKKFYLEATSYDYD